MIKYYSRYFKQLRAKHNPLIKAELDAMIDAGIRQYEDTGSINTLPNAGLVLAIFNLHIEAGTRWAKYTQNSISKKSTKAYERKDATDEYNAFIREYLNRNLMNKSVIPITDTERKIMLQVISNGVAEGLGVKKIAANLKDLKMGTARSRLIVRTETGRAMNTGAMFAAANSNVVVNKIWNSAQQDRTRRIPRDQTDHLHMDGIKVGYDEFFFIPGKKGVDAMQYPCDINGRPENVCNCRCAVSFEPTTQRRNDLVRNEFIDIIQFIQNSVSLVSNAF